MENFLFIAVIIFFIIFLFAQDSKKETTRERYGEAIGQAAHSAASTIADIAHNIAEPASKKEIRLAKEALANRNGALYRFDNFSQKERIKNILSVDEYFEKKLNLLGLSIERWKKIGTHIFYIGIIRRFSRDSSDYSKKNQDYNRESILNSWTKYPELKDKSDIVREALRYFKISENEWIKYGDTVLEMYNVNDTKDIEEYGIISNIKPMRNNLHLL